MSRVISVVACGLMVAACSSSIPGLDFLKSSPTTAALRFESEPPGAEVKVSGQTCRTPCELKLQVAELSAAFALKGYQPQTISVRSESSVLSGASFVPNPVHADLQPVAGQAKKRAKKQTPVATSENSSEAAPDSSSAPETNAPATNTPFPARGDVR
jgi:PEGA domain